jgi:hypothetical protein
MSTSRGERNIHWIEKYCVEPNGSRKGKPVQLTEAQRVIIRVLYDEPGGLHADVPVTGALAAYIALLHTCGVEAPAPPKDFNGPAINVDLWTVWAATTKPLQAVLERNGNRIICPELGTAFPAAA